MLLSDVVQGIIWSFLYMQNCLWSWALRSMKNKQSNWAKIYQSCYRLPPLVVPCWESHLHSLRELCPCKVEIIGTSMRRTTRSPRCLKCEPYQQSRRVLVRQFSETKRRNWECRSKFQVLRMKFLERNAMKWNFMLPLILCVIVRFAWRFFPP